ncbi:glycosyltransferase family 92 protein [Pseudomonas juntendi]|uniref:hypothetical protein n=1 Tax=Pseudomonas TaxID=286 RepID=UPI0002FBF293|nr:MULTISPECIES: hypothetical protein [Pseudomonas]MBA6122366.1 hypothetical protein [Pseudomonas juntendi]MBH3386443.1 hypothetical protein [Pseudomonas juntendi]MCF3157177.1 glycosyltransferase family 92 protein [Pseudomonas juntendi]MCL8330594.1 glycosyltransferase family 92 protein [Pseudomonas juntendi]MCQ1990934.1 glycosyltransferase family 92 protein [Pseudomonas sp. Eb3]
MMQWKTEQQEICSLIRSNYSPLKIVLKIKDDWEMFPDFFDHHAKIVGAQNIYVFDNNSTNAELLDKYKKLPIPENVFSFDTFHNDIHSPEKFTPLYQALQHSSRHFTFLDSDERLYLMSEEGYSTSIIEYLSQLDVSIPGIWLSNAPGSKNIFSIGDSGEKLETGLTWGKPIFSSYTKLDGYINHNIQALEHVYDGLQHRAVFVLHLNNFSPTQRINANLRKLVARGFISKDDTIDDVLNAKTSAHTDLNIKLYLEEIRKLHSQDAIKTDVLSAGHLKLDKLGALSFFSEKERDLLATFLSPTSSIAFPDKDKSLIRLVGDSTTSTPSLKHQYRGHIDGLSSNKITGWAVDYFGNSTSLKVYINGIERLIAHSVIGRPDLKSGGISKGQGGFFVNLSGMINPGDKVKVTFLDNVVVSGGSLEATS